MTKKEFYLTIDLEEWYHLFYFRKYTQLRGKDHFVFKTLNILAYLNQMDIKATFFVLAELAKKYPEIIKAISRNGHEIACHGYNHELITEKNIQIFEHELVRAKTILEGITNQKVLGYRAPCFSLTDNTLSKLSDLGFKYDSSFIKFSDNNMSRELQMENYKRLNSVEWIHKKSSFKEFQIPTVKLHKFQVPISGGGYIRIIPFPIFRYIFKRELKKRYRYLFFLHPFELDPSTFHLPINASRLETLRFHFGRKSSLKKISKLIKLIRENGYEFKRMKDALVK